VTLSSSPLAAAISAALRYDSRIAVLGPVGRIAVELRLVCDQHLSDKPSGVVHGLTGDRRRLHSLAEGGEGGASISNFEPVDDDPMLSPAREERVHDEAQRARDLLERGVEQRAFSLEPSHLDDELGLGPLCDPRCHPLWQSDESPPAEAAALSFWLAGRLPLATSLRASCLASTCPLKRLCEVNDAMRLLLCNDPARFRHRLRLQVETPASDGCHGIGIGGSATPRTIVAEAPPSYAWVADNSFPHG